MRKPGIAITVLMLLLSVIPCIAIAQETSNPLLEEVKKITEGSKQLIASGVVKEIAVQPIPNRLITIDGWTFWMNSISEHWRAVIFAKEGLRGPSPPASLVKLKSLADEHGVSNYTLLKVYTVRQSDNPPKTFIVHAHRGEFGIATYNDTDKMVTYLNLEGLNIKLKPALFFANGEDTAGKFTKVLVVDEDNVSKLHRGDSKYVIVKFYPVAMKVSSSGTINTPPKDLYPWKGKRQE